MTTKKAIIMFLLSILICVIAGTDWDRFLDRFEPWSIQTGRDIRCAMQDCRPAMEKIRNDRPVPEYIDAEHWCDQFGGTAGIKATPELGTRARCNDGKLIIED